MLAAIKLGAVIIPASTLLQPGRPGRPGPPRATSGTWWPRPRSVRKFADVPGDWTRVSRRARRGQPTAPPAGTATRTRRRGRAIRARTGRRRPADPLLLYFTSGTTSQPKLVGAHARQSYPVGHLSTMYWIGIAARRRPPEHLLARLGQARLEQRVRPVERAGHDPHPQPDQVQPPACCSARSASCGVTTFCAPPTVWRMLIQADLGAADVQRAARVRRRGRAAQPGGDRAGPQGLGITVRDGFGQTETTAQVGNTPGQPVKPGSMGRPLPGYPVVLVDPVGGRARRGRARSAWTCRARRSG